MEDERVAVDVPVVKSLSEALEDLKGVFTFSVGSTPREAQPQADRTGLREWDESWHKFVAFCETVHDVIMTTQGQIAKIQDAIEGAADVYTVTDHENVQALTPP
jgi:hypothetical protein